MLARLTHITTLLIMILMNVNRGIHWTARLLVAALALTGCSAATNPSTPTTGTITVIASAYPLQFLTQRIVGDAGTVTNLTQPGQEPHDLELSAQQIADMSTSDAVVYIPGFQTAVDEAIKTSPPKMSIDVAAGIDRLVANADGSESPATPGQDQSSLDPHIWLSPKDMITMANTISTQLSTENPALASTFAANTTKLVADLTNLDADFSAGLASCQRTEFVTSHAAFAYLAKAYGLAQIPIAGLDPTQEPTAARIAEVQKLAKQYGVTTIFFETLVSPAVAQSIAGDLHLKTAVLDPIEGITSESAGTNYLEVMNANLTALQEANGCS
jgi:zinc transport system substrate-binding protein